MTLPVSLFPSMRQMPLDLGPSAPPGLSDFETGDNIEMLRWLAQWPHSETHEVPLPAYLWGPAGCGKSHLLRALAYQAHSLGWQVLWLGTQGLQSLESSQDIAPTLVLMDDCHALDDMQQHWAFNMFIEAASALSNTAGSLSGAISIVAAGQCPPIDLPIREDLRTRLGWGLVFAVQPLSEDGVRQALVRESQRRGLKCADGVVPYMLTHFNRNLGYLMQLVSRLDRFSLAEKREITVPLLKQMLEQEHLYLDKSRP
jgi:DnaA-homolog protein